ncbi:peroxisomal NADH pyrophosphatase-like protein NUDT12 [Dothidotthia symphoricarpi CBS 119687]|uniref:NAD(+) diphosphatase n=1 Tax=Dothidotthia symphoricarpi CBS 119687 TaxID=1392245 RepID=A0A6A5ZZX9_9PLEO|nr:peroxisomal NADH pyrophosphatase-like protein NUDT12 [Dothidotthia symphoricarpi CBS 119687]KAF2125312.1 peroxisomal NADH pyrophosphatase-like protein NUDT12 [Dothidotthia symphoricarpi CBS 119687]
MPQLPTPALPEPAHPEVDSMLSRRFGKEIANYYSGSPLNRVGFLRTDNTFLSLALRHPSTTVLLFKNLEPLLKSPSELATVTFDDVKSVIGDDPFGRPEADTIAQYNSSLYIPQIIFLGLDERKEKEGFVYREHYKGQPWFAVDVTPKESVTDAAEKLIEKVKSEGLDFSKGRMNMSLHAQEAAIYAEARHLLDWNARNPFCASCGYKTLSVNAGFKRTCPPADIANAVTDTNARPPCATRTGISNLCFPRTDPTVIMAVVSADGQRILLGRQKRWPPHWYSTLAGFLEPAESVEEAVRREVWEESGIHLGRVVIHSTQPWPYPANLMIGAIGQAIPEGETVHLGHDAELEDAKWFSAEEVREALRVGTSGLGEDAGSEYKEGGLRLPPSTAIANQLMTAVVNGFASGSPMI